MKIPFDDAVKYLLLALVFLCIAWIFNQGQAPPRPSYLPPHAEEPPVAALFAVAGLGWGMLAGINFVRELRARWSD